MSVSMSQVIINNLVYNSEYFGKVIPFLEVEYFARGPYRIAFELIHDYFKQHNGSPSVSALSIMLDKKQNLNQKEFDGTKTLIGMIEQAPENMKWLVDETEKFVQERAMDIALSEALAIRENFSKPLGEQDRKIKDIGAIPEIMKKALSVGFTFDVGHEYKTGSEARWKSYTEKTSKIPFMTHMLNKITKGGVELKTLNLLLAGSNVGKSLGLCHLASEYLLRGLDVLYVSMEMSEEAVGKRIDANLLDISLDDLDSGLILEKEYYNRFDKKVIKTGVGNLFVKQFPTGGASSTHINTLLDELEVKKGFKPQVIIVDYLGIMCSSRIKFSENTYTLVKSIAEELRGMAIERNVVIWSAAQTTRGAWDTVDINMSDVAESAGLVHTADMILAIAESEELADLGQQMFKQIKSRYGDKNKDSKFPLVVEKGKQRWSDLDATSPYTVVFNRSDVIRTKKTEEVVEQESVVSNSIEDVPVEKKKLFVKSKKEDVFSNIDISEEDENGVIW